MRSRLGLESDRPPDDENTIEVSEHNVLSPFEFQEQVQILVPTDLPGPEAGGSAFHEETAGVIADFSGVTDGGLFALFTSYGALRAVARALRERGMDQRWPLYVQGEGDRHRQLGAFVDSGRGILLGTSSFWEGVDVPGEPLRGLVIQKLPFRVPTEPVTAARMEAIAGRGLDPFQHFMLPHAALRLKQGFGRLIRSRSDRGTVLILDDRVVRKRYGRYLRDSLPDAPFHKGPWPEIRRRLHDFYEGP